MGGVSEANDVLQETNLKLCNKAADYDPTQPFLRWAYVFARFEVMAWRKRQARSRLVLDDELVAVIASDWEGNAQDAAQQITALEGCLEKLPKKQRDLLDARYGRGEAVQDIAARQCRTENAMSALFYRVRKSLADCIELALRNATAAQLEQLRELLHRDEAYRHAYQEQVKVHAYLTWQHGRASINEPIVTPPISTSPAKPRNWTAPMLGLALSLLIVVGGLTTWWQWNLARVPLVVISSTDPTYVKGARVFLDSVHLRQGTFRFRLDSGAEVEAVGPVDFELLSDMHLRIVQGSVTVDVGDDAIGFQVDTAEANIVDLGTRFGVSVSDAGQTDVVVFEGEVDVHPPSAKPQPKDRIANLKEGEAIRIDKSSVPKRLTSVVIRGDWNEVLEGSNHPSPVIVDLTDNG
ncbi:sigF, partial [Symbiodinium sp. CCMP2456]